MKRNLVYFSALVGFSMGIGSVMAADAPAPVKTETPAVKMEKSKDVAVERKAKEERLVTIQDEISILKRQDSQLRDAIRKQFMALETFQTNINTQDQEFIALNEQLKEANARVGELRAKLKQKTDSMPEFKDATAQMTAIQSQMQDNSRKLTELLKEKSRLNSEIFAAMQKDQPPVKTKPISPVQPGPAVETAPVPGK
jgi:chromosome segregation ATPase